MLRFKPAATLRGKVAPVLASVNIEVASTRFARAIGARVCFVCSGCSIANGASSATASCS